MDKIVVPNIYFWMEEYQGQPTIMTAAFRWKSEVYGLSYPADSNAVQRKVDKKTLINNVKATLDTLVHHGISILNINKNIDYSKVRDAEANRFWLDPLWKKKIEAFNKTVLIKKITREEAVQLKFLSK